MASIFDAVLSCIIGCEHARVAAFDRVGQEHFLPAEQPHYLIFAALKRYYDRYKKIPSKEALLHMIEAAAQANPLYFALMPQAKAVAEAAYSGPICDEDYGTELLQQFLMDRDIKRPLAAAVAGTADSSVMLPNILRSAEEKLRSVEMLDRRNVPDGAIRLSQWKGDILIDPIMSGVQFVDENMPTGPRMVNVLLGPTGGGKTILACQILCGCAGVQHANDKLAGKSQSGWFGYFGYEGSIKRPQSIIISHLAKVPRSRLMQITSLSELSTTEKPSQSDIDLFRRGEVTNVIGEQERIEEKKEIIENYVRIFNFSGVDEDGSGHSFGFGGVPEIADLISRVNDKLGVGVRYVVIDWAGMVVQNYLRSSRRQFESNYTLELSRFVYETYTKIAVPFNCAVLVLHQLRGALGRTKGSVASRVTHADAEWCSNFAVNAWYAFCLGYKDEETNICTISWTKTRDQRTTPPVVCRLDGELSRFVSVSDLYQIDYALGKIVPREEVKAAATRPTIRVMSF